MPILSYSNFETFLLLKVNKYPLHYHQSCNVDIYSTVKYITLHSVLQRKLLFFKLWTYFISKCKATIVSLFIPFRGFRA